MFGYDFLSDGATEVRTALNARPGLNVPASATFINQTWTQANVISALLTTAPSVASLNGHADHSRFQPPSVPNALTRPVPFTTTNLTATAAATLPNRLVFSMGCHAGLSVGDALVAQQALDWPQGYSREGATYLGNTTFGYGDTNVVAYSEELNRLLAEQVRAGGPIGDALRLAKNEYFSTRGVFGVYDEKAMAAFTLYGMPMWSIGAPTQPASVVTGGIQPLEAASGASTLAIPATTVGTDPVTGLPIEQFDASPAFTQVPPSGTSYFLRGDSGVQVSHLRPIQPKMVIELGGTQAHGALVTGLTSTDAGGVNPVYARPIVDQSANEPELSFNDVAYPSKLLTVRSFQVAAGIGSGSSSGPGSSSAIPPPWTPPGPASSAATRGSKGTSTARRAPTGSRRRSRRSTRSPSRATPRSRSRSPAATPSGCSPATGREARASGSSSISPRARPAAGAAAGPWPRRPSSTSSRSSTRPATSVSRRTRASTSTAPRCRPTRRPTARSSSSRPLRPATTAGSRAASWSASTAPRALPCRSRSTAARSCPPAPTTQVTVTGDGVHRVEARDATGRTDVVLIPIDATAPDVAFGTPAAGRTYDPGSTQLADYECVDRGSGAVTCNGTVNVGQPISTTVGTKTFSVTTRDRAGNEATRTITYNVAYRKILFTSQRTGSGDIYAMNPDGSGVTRLTDHSAPDEEPAWSPDGTQIAFASRRTTLAQDIFVMDADGSNVRRLTTASRRRHGARLVARRVEDRVPLDARRQRRDLRR